MMADDNAIDVATQNGAEPYAGMRADFYITYDGTCFGDEDALAKFGFLAEEFIQLRVHFHQQQVTRIWQIVKMI